MSWTLRLKVAMCVLVALLATALVGGLQVAHSEQPPQANKAAGAGAQKPQAEPPAKVATSPPVDEDARVYPTTISGQAIDEQERPVAGATIYLVKANGEEKVLGQTTTDANGHYEFRDAPLESNGVGPWIEMAYFRVVGKAPGKAFAWRGMKNLFIDPEVAARAGMREGFKGTPDPRPTGFIRGEKIELELIFFPAKPITGRIVDETGQPVKGASVTLRQCDYLDAAGKPVLEHENFRLWLWTTRKAPFVMPDQLYAVSDAEGKFELPSVPPNVVCNLGFSYPNFAQLTLYTSTVDNPPAMHRDQPVLSLPLELKLRSVRTVPVLVTFADTGEAVADVSLAANTITTAQPSPSHNYAGGYSDKEGKLTLKLPTGQYKLRGDPPHDINYIRTEQEFTVEESPAEQPITLKLQRGCLLILKAVDADSGAPIQGVTFRSRGRSIHLGWWEGSNPPTDENGEARGVAIPGSERYGFGPGLPGGYRPADPEEDRPGRTIELPEGGTVREVFKLRK